MELVEFCTSDVQYQSLKKGGEENSWWYSVNSLIKHQWIGRCNKNQKKAFSVGYWHISQGTDEWKESVIHGKLYFCEYRIENTLYGYLIMKNSVHHIHIKIISYSKYALLKKQQKVLLQAMQSDMHFSLGISLEQWQFCTKIKLLHYQLTAKFSIIFYYIVVHLWHLPIHISQLYGGKADNWNIGRYLFLLVYFFSTISLWCVSNKNTHYLFWWHTYG